MHRRSAIVPLDLLAQAARYRPPEYYVEVILSGKIHGETLHIPFPIYRALLKRYSDYPSQRPEHLTYHQVTQRINEAPHDPPWTMLKEELRILTAHLSLHHRRSSCWKSRQKSRLITQYRTVKKKLQAESRATAAWLHRSSRMSQKRKKVSNL